MEFKQAPDNGSLFANQSKKTPKSPDYFGTIAIDLSNTVNFKTEDGLTIVKLSGWKKQSKSGTTYLSIAVDRWVPTAQEQPKAKPSSGFDDMDDSIPF